jgi:hypothetical protein
MTDDWWHIKRDCGKPCAPKWLLDKRGQMPSSINGPESNFIRLSRDGLGLCYLLYQKEGWPISRGGLRAPRPGRRYHWRRCHNDFGIVGRDEFHSRATRAAVAQQALRVALHTRPVLLIVNVPTQLLLKAGRNSDQWRHPTRLCVLARRDHIEP